jgi:triacylglycerol esterase/lipase EstA (alpha/beta hydrolase family)
VETYLVNDLRVRLEKNFRVFLYGYDSGWMFDAPEVTVRSLAQGLLETVRVKHRGRRRLLFVAHSHGGIVVKEALVLDYLARQEDGLSNCTDGLIFLGTPHKGSHLAHTAKIFSSLLAAWGSNDELLAALETGYKPLRQWHQNFMEVLRSRLEKNRIQVWNYFEERPTTIINFGLGLRYSELVRSQIIP